MAKPIRITVGGNGPYDPVPGGFDVIIPSLKGLDFYVGAPGYGPIPYGNYSALPGGGFRMITTLADEDVYWVYITGLLYGEDTTGSYTNGFYFNKVISALMGRIGWMQTPDGPTLDNTNLLSKGGRKFNDGSFHALVTLKNISYIMDQANASNEDFNAYLISLQRGIILRALNGVFNEPELICQNLLYNRWSFGNDEPIENKGKFMAVQIQVPPRLDIATQIDSVALYFDSDVTFNLYLFSDVKKAPLFTIEVSAEAYNQTVVELTDVILNHIGGANHGGIFYLGYFQDDLGGARAIHENNVAFKANSPYGAITIEAAKTGAVDFDKKNISYTIQSNGLNPFISVFRDHTWQILKKPSLFDNLIGLQMTAQVVEQGLFANRSNSTERNLKEGMDKIQASMDLTGVAPITDGPPRTTGLRKQIEQELTRVKQSFFPKAKPMSVSLC